ncbi:hypothetical protein K505DRAFT_338109 [Melanomma pulvis-pyrius CBS 109.77]|uniref:ATP-grasp domain-containing protein n=1 Tax=Melanomma pulvis-pyrius CBS 109.77 TaxID=1314802 RepID=A0A6A6X9L7_9PLEO|nr:hypothetical protein K505DRAFT_338109 [Melanomma pulvis-pyrius CBS 109.77]
MRILLTSASAPAALALARILSASGHTVFGADLEAAWGTAPARYSRAYAQFFRVRYGDSILDVVEKIGGMELIIPFGDTAPSATDVGKLKEKGIKLAWHDAFDIAAVFQDFVQARVLTYPTDSDNPLKEDDMDNISTVVTLPLSFSAPSHPQLGAILAHFPDTEFALEISPYDDDGDTLVDLSCENGVYVPVERKTIRLCYNTIDQKTIREVENLPISEMRPYRITELLSGGGAYEAHALINGGAVQTFVVTTNEGGLEEGEFTIVPPTEPLVDILHSFLARFADEWQVYAGQRELDMDPFIEAPKAIVSHISLRFNVKEEVIEGHLVKRITALDMHNLPHTSLMLLAAIPGARDQLVRAYTAPTENALLPVLTPDDIPLPRGVYALPTVLTEVRHSLRGFSPFRWQSWMRVAQLGMMLLVWGLGFKEEMWCAQDPGPALVEWVVRRPVVSLVGLRGVKWVWEVYRGLSGRMRGLMRRLLGWAKLGEKFKKL